MGAPRGRPPGPQARFLQLAELLKQRLLAGAWPPRSPLPSLRQLSSQYAVGLQVVRLALRKLKQEGFVALNPRRRLVAGTLATPTAVTANIVALIHTAPLHSGPDWSAVLLGIESKLADTRHPLLLLHRAPILRQVIPDELVRLSVKGVLLFGQFTEAVLEQYENLQTPVVLVDQPTGRPLHSVSVDNIAAARDATARLIALGHRRIALLGIAVTSVRKIDPDSKERANGFQQAIAQAGLNPEENRVFTRTAQEGPRGLLARAILNARPRCTAVLAVDSPSAEMIARAAAVAQLSVPRDLSIVAFHSDTGSGGRWSGPRSDFRRIGEAAVALLDVPKSKPVHQRISATWHDGETIAPPAPMRRR